MRMNYAVQVAKGDGYEEWTFEADKYHIDNGIMFFEDFTEEGQPNKTVFMVGINRLMTVDPTDVETEEDEDKPITAVTFEQLFRKELEKDMENNAPEEVRLGAAQKFKKYFSTK